MAIHESFGGSGNKALWFSSETIKILDQIKDVSLLTSHPFFGITCIVNGVVPTNEIWLVSIRDNVPRVITKFIVDA